MDEKTSQHSVLVDDLADSSIITGDIAASSGSDVLPVPAAVSQLPSDFESIHDPRIPEDQQSFKIGETAELIGVKAYVLRYWEQVLRGIKPDKSPAGQRRYRREDVALFMTIRRLRYDERRSVSEIKDLLANQGVLAQKMRPEADSVSVQAAISKLRDELQGMLQDIQA